MIKKTLTILGICLVLGIIAYPKVQPLLSSDGDGEEQSASQEESSLMVDGFVTSHTQLENKIFTTGTILSNEEVELSSEINGKITDIYFKEGQKVEKGDLLIKINDSELQAELERVNFRLKLAKTREKRQRKLLEEGGVSQGEYDTIVNEMKVLEAEKRLIEAQIDKTEIRAPFDGIIGLKYVSEGSYISPSTRIASLQDISSVKIDFSIPERYYNIVDEGDQINFNVGGSDKNYVAEIYAIEPKIDVDTRTLQIRAISSNENFELLPGAFADMELTLETIDNAIMIPTIALIPQIDENKVYLYKNGKVVDKSVRTGIRRNKHIQIVEGLSVGDTLLTSGLLQVKPDAEVTMREVNKEINLGIQ